MVTFVFEDGLLVLTVKVVLLWPAGTVTLAGTVATLVLLLESVTPAPPEGAAPESVIVPVDLLPPLTLVGLSVSEERVTAPPGVTVNVVCFELLPRVAVIATLVVVVTDCVLTVKVALVLPPPMVTLEGTAATEVFELDRVTTVPPEGALALRVTAPVELLPPLTLVGFRINEETVGLELPGLTVKLADTVAPPDWA
jgi:hypothetical protein